MATKETWQRDPRALSLEVRRRRRGAHGHIAMHVEGHGQGGGPMLSIFVSDKRQVVREHPKDRREPSASLYAPTWRAAGWDNVAKVYRVEVRARREGLALRALDRRAAAAPRPRLGRSRCGGSAGRPSAPWAAWRS